MSEPEELLDCPFCGCKQDGIRRISRHRGDCFMILPEGSPLREEAWNNRASGQVRRAKLNVLAHRLEIIARMIDGVETSPTRETLDVANDELHEIAQRLRNDGA